MKKALFLLALAVLLICLVACNDHEHTFSDSEWANDADYHWRPCTAQAGCTEQHDRTAHDYELYMTTAGGPVYRCTVCGMTKTEMISVPEHEHTYGEALKFDTAYHWVGCTVEGCTEATERFEHAFGNPEVSYADGKIETTYTCVDCGFGKKTEQTVSTEVEGALDWNDAFKNFKLVNFTMDVFFKQGAMTHTNHCVVTENEAYYCIPDANEFYTVPNGDGTYTTYIRGNSKDPFTKLNDTSDTYLIGAQTETVIQVSFEENFDKFTYDKESASYVCKEEIESTFYSFDGKPMGTLVSFNNVVKVTNGAISYIEADYYIGSQSSNYSQSFKYYNIGMSAVEVPQSVIDGCIPDDGSFDLEEGGEEDEGYHDQEKVEGETFNSDGLQTEVVEAN